MLNASAQNFVPSWAAASDATVKRQYSKAFLQANKESTVTRIRRNGWVSAGPFDRLPPSVAEVVGASPQRSIAFIDMNVVAATMEGTRPQRHAGGPPLTPMVLDEQARFLDIVATARKRCSGYVLGPFLAQPGDVIAGLLLIELALRFKKASIKMQQLVAKHPAVIDRVREFLVGPGFHILPPLVQNHDHWEQLMARLKFDWIRDNRTRIFTELSKYWKKSNTPFEQFVHFFFFRAATPAHEVKGMLTHAQKPVMVATLAGDLDAVIILADLGFYIPPDYFWEMVGFAGSSEVPAVLEIRRVLAHMLRQQQHKAKGTRKSQQQSLPPPPALPLPPRPESQEPAALPAAARARDPKNPWGR